MHEYSLAHLSMIAVPPMQLVRVARETGYEYTGFRLTPSPSTGIDHGLLGDTRELDDLRRAIDDSGVRILDVEVIRMKDPSAVETARPLLEAARILGARYAIATIEDSDHARRVDTLAAVAQLAASQGVSIAVEFMLFSAARTLSECVEVVQAAGQPNVVVLADVLHLIRSGGAPADLERYPASLFPYAQVCGAVGANAAADPEAARAEAVRSRLMPSDGDLPVRAFCNALPPSTILSVEAPLDGQALPSDPIALAVRMLASARRAAGDAA